MFRQSATRLCAAQDAQRQKMATLFKIVSGETQFKNKAPVKDCNITAVFGADWKPALQKWYAADVTAKLDAADKKASEEKLAKYLARIELTRYTARELASYMVNGAHAVSATADADQVAKGAAFLKEAGEPAFNSHVEAEAKLANWTPEQTAAFVKKVKSA